MRSALAFLTPLGGARSPDRHTFAWFPVVGAALGAALGAAWWGADRWWPAAVAAGLVVAADLALTGMLHVDGLADSSDGLLPQVDRTTRLRIMAEPTLGTYAVAVVGVVLLLRWSSLAAMRPDVLLVASLWCASRTVMAVGAGALPYARDGGLATALLGGRWRPIGAGGAVLATVLAAPGGWPHVAALAAAGVVGASVLTVGARRLGGFTGDVLGAAGVLAETTGLVVAAASW